MFFLTRYLLAIISLVFLYTITTGCNDPEDSEYLKKTRNTKTAIIERSGTKIVGPEDVVFEDAQNRLRTGGGVLGKTGSIFDFNNNKSKGGVGVASMPINPFLWRASLEAIEFIPLVSAEPFGGIIITDWYSVEELQNERCKVNIFIKGAELRSDNIKANIFCQELNNNNNWIDRVPDKESNIKLEDSILNIAKKIKLSQG